MPSGRVANLPEHEIAAVRRLVEADPDRSTQAIAHELGMPPDRVKWIRKRCNMAPSARSQLFAKSGEDKQDGRDWFARSQKKLAEVEVVTPVAQPLTFAPLSRSRIMAGR